ncbi:MAG: penicillin acylase family protein [Nostoc sp. ChiQUE01b]|nr:penicillin acylase family protein [Nostoc sp. ChiQUE01b]MDZ8258446.1 penicillin acylase family protein [Nostoc sp. ChiQUE01b]
MAWGVTNVQSDVIDLDIEKINPNNLNQYEVNGKWVDMQLVQETIQIAGSQPIGYPAKRIVKMISQQTEAISLKDMQQIQGDDRNLNVQTLVS